LNTVTKRIQAEIAARGAIPFARFMEMALYCPDCGFYEIESDTIGKRGDFYTSVSVGGLFGRLLAFQFADWLAELGTRNSQLGTAAPRIVEAGAHNGRLAKDILTWLRERRPELFEVFEFWIVEPSGRLRRKQEQTLREFAGKVRWAGTMVELGAVCGVIYSNELLDAMPVRRVGWDAQRREWFEWGVTLAGQKFVWTKLDEPGADRSADSLVRATGGMEASRRARLSALHDLPPELLNVLPDGFTTELSPVAEDWWREAAGVLERGKILTFDYGLSAEEFFSPERKDGTLRSYHHHKLIADVLANPGEQDITAHVNFTGILAAGDAAGLRTGTFQSQTKFLTDIASRAWKTESGFGLWTEEHTRQFQTLTHPDHLGRAFRVLVQSR
jgi:SAM-dependent MidA family methyltransferase